jgi:SAM-dependent methyltransferase
MKNWFATWFNTPYYHLLYKDRNHLEAQHFLSNLLQKLNPTSNSKFLDVACGKGRHSVYINQQGFTVFGIDLSSESITYAQQFENDNLHFAIHDMRLDFQENSYDYVLNLFTSFGYFEKDEDNQKAINSMANNLQVGGKVIIDFMNAKKVISNLVFDEIKKTENIDFHIQRKTEDGYIIKDIRFQNKGEEFHFQERVQVLCLSDFSKYLQNAGLKVINLWGDYELNDFDVINSNRLIIVAQK